jgi:non-ribosomal peptide synthetase component F
MDGYRSIAAILGVLKAGHAYVPLDVSYPVGRIRYMATDSGMRVVLSERAVVEDGPLTGGWFVAAAGTVHGQSEKQTDTKNGKHEPGEGGTSDETGGKRQIVELDTEWEEIVRGYSAEPLPTAAGDGGGGGSDGAMAMAYILYTSGSTGRPKGVCGLHAATMNRFEWMYREYPFEPNGACACACTCA